MLRSFRVQNHKSIKDEVELLLLPAYDKSGLAVPVTGIFGANASGKSNLLGGLGWMRRAVRTSFANWEPDGGVPRSPFKLAAECAEAPSTFVVEVVVDGVRLTYGFVVDSSRVLEEWLYSYPRGKKRVVFERTGADFRFGSTINQRYGALLEELTRENALLLSVAAQSSVPEAKPVYQWFSRDLSFIVPGHRQIDADDLTWWDADSQHRHQLTALLRAADLGISNIRVEKFAPPMTPIAIDRKWPAVAFTHGQSEPVLELAEQSHGTQALLHLLIRVLRALERGSTLCVDEFDASLHPRLTARVIELFKNDQTNPLHAQLIFTTHDATFLGTSFGVEILARDEIWFTEKDQSGVTTMFPLTDFHPRKEENTERRYLGGSYGAVPSVFSGPLIEVLRASVTASTNDR